MFLKKMIVCTLIMSSAGSFVHAMDPKVMVEDSQNKNENSNRAGEQKGKESNETLTEFNVGADTEEDDTWCGVVREVCCYCRIGRIPFFGLLDFFIRNVCCGCRSDSCCMCVRSCDDNDKR